MTGEEYGLLGAVHWVQHPTWPLEKIAADINFDGIGTEVYGPMGMIMGLRVANVDTMPMWRTTSPFNKPRNPPKTLPAN